MRDAAFAGKNITEPALGVNRRPASRSVSISCGSGNVIESSERGGHGRLAITKSPLREDSYLKGPGDR
jgi:hypothetical protein